MIIATFFGVLILGIAIGMPIAYSLLLCGVALMLFLGNFDAQIIAQNMTLGIDNFLLLAIPGFILAGEFMNRGGLSRRIIDVALAFCGHVVGGLGYVGVFSALILASLSGSAIADSAALAAILVPMMRQAGYPAGRSVGLLAAGGVIAPIIPPSIAFVVYGAVANVSIGKMFMAGVVPGLLMGLALILTWFWVSRGANYKTLPRRSWGERGSALVKGIPALVLPVIIIGGLRFGIFTPTEAAVVAAVYALFAGAVIYRELDLRGVYDCLVSTTRTTAVVMFLIGASGVSGWLVVTADLPRSIIDLMQPFMGQPMLVVGLLLLVTLVLGCVLDFTPLMLILMPVAIPICRAAGVDLVYFGVVFVMAGALGLLTPPVGNVLNVVAGVSRTRMNEVIGGVMPFLLAEISVVVLLVVFPGFVTWPLHNFFIAGR